MRRFLLPWALALTVFVSPVKAEQSVQFDGYLAHYNAFTSDLLDPKVASQFGIQRSHNRAVLMVNVQRAGSPPAGIPAKVRASAETMNRQSRDIVVREVKEGETFYYLADFPVTNGDILDFRVWVQPAGLGSPYEFGFRQQFFTEGPKGK